MALTFQPLKQTPPPVRNRSPRPQRFAFEHEHSILSEPQFVASVSRERRRTERSGKPFLLMLLELPERFEDRDIGFEKKITSALVALSRETDVVGWYQEKLALGVIFTELGDTDQGTVLKSVQQRVKASIADCLDGAHGNGIHISFHLYPEGNKSDERSADLHLYPEFERRTGAKKAALSAKRALDVVVSGSALLLLSPLLTIIAVAIKLTSKGPVVFRQGRVGQYGKPFTFLKFRSMYVNNDPSIHKEYVTKLITGKTASNQDGAKVYKITNDPRITPLGRFLRKTSLDELPQLINVLLGEMSLIGPRPPVPYEFETYDIWHRRRVLEIKPGITGLWQVNGRSRTSFDDMVRLDLKYARVWSVWLDLKILAQTPAAVIQGEGAH